MSDRNQPNSDSAFPSKEPGGAIVYNVTVKVHHSIADEWLKWLTNEHAPRIIATNCFNKFTTLRLLEHDDDEGVTYAVQYFAENIATYQRYIDEYAEGFRKESLDKWGNKFVAFRTVMEVVN